jgi:hypothetical protein
MPDSKTREPSDDDSRAEDNAWSDQELNIHDSEQSEVVRAPSLAPSDPDINTTEPLTEQTNSLKSPTHDEDKSSDIGNSKSMILDPDEPHDLEIPQPTVTSHDHEPSPLHCATPTRASEEARPTQNQPMNQATHAGPEIWASTSITPQDGSRSRRIRRTRIFNLNACECGYEISSLEIENGDTVMQCKVPGCETVWVSCPVIKIINLLMDSVSIIASA